jgi:hypothetical protein
LGSGEDAVRAAYCRAVQVAHPDAGGSPAELQAVHTAYDVLAWDAWRHDEGAAALRKELEGGQRAGRERPESGGLKRDGGEEKDSNVEVGTVATSATAGEPGTSPPPQSPPHPSPSTSASPPLPRIFVAIVVYRDPEAQHTLRDMFEKAAYPQRIYAGVVWQYKLKRPGVSSSSGCASTSIPSASTAEEEVDRLHPEVNMLTRAVEFEAAKSQDAGEQTTYLNKMKPHQLEGQRVCDAQEAERHGKAGVGELPATNKVVWGGSAAQADGGGDAVGHNRSSQSSTPTSTPKTRKAQPPSARSIQSPPWVWGDHVRETHKPWSSAEGPCHAKHLAQRLWGGEEYCLHVDARARFDWGWDEVLLHELELAERGGSRSRDGDGEQARQTTEAGAVDGAAAGAGSRAGAVLTGYPLGYRMRHLPVKDDEGMATMGFLPVYGGKSFESRKSEAGGASDDAVINGVGGAPTVAAVAVHSFGNRLCHPAAVRLAHRRPPSAGGSPPLPPPLYPALLPNPSFLFARSPALLRDCPPDPHAPFLFLGEELSLGARLWTRGWDLFLPNRCPVTVCYDPRHRASELTEDRRSGRLLYADPYDSGRGPPDVVEQRGFLNLQSQRRVLQLIGAPDQDSATSNEEDAVVLDGQWGVGAVRGVREFLDHLGVDFNEREVSQRARSAGLPSGALRWNYNNTTRTTTKTTTAANAGQDSGNETRAGMSRAEDAEWGGGVVAGDGLPLRWRGGAGGIEHHLVAGAPEGVGG